MRKKVLSIILCLVLSVSALTTVCAAGTNPNYWTNKEIIQLYYKGYIQFKPSYVCTGKYGTTSGKKVRQAYINYTRNGESVCGGRQYTDRAYARTEKKIYSAEASCWDTMNPFADETKFWYNWINF